jgi:hypothetical protein
MTTTTTDRALLLALVALAIAIEGLALLLRPLVAHSVALLLTLAGWRPSPSRAASGALQGAQKPLDASSIPSATTATTEPLEALPVRELRQLARAAGHRSLARSGRRQQLLEVLV